MKADGEVGIDAVASGFPVKRRLTGSGAEEGFLPASGIPASDCRARYPGEGCEENQRINPMHRVLSPKHVRPPFSLSRTHRLESRDIRRLDEAELRIAPGY